MKNLEEATSVGAPPASLGAAYKPQLKSSSQPEPDCSNARAWAHTLSDAHPDSQSLHTGLTSDLLDHYWLAWCHQTVGWTWLLLPDMLSSPFSGTLGLLPQRWHRSCACLVPASLHSPSPCCSPTHLSSVRHTATLAQFSACQNEPFLYFEKVILEDQPALQSSFVIQISLPFNPMKQAPQKDKHPFFCSTGF